VHARGTDATLKELTSRVLNSPPKVFTMSRKIFLHPSSFCMRKNKSQSQRLRKNESWCIILCTKDAITLIEVYSNNSSFMFLCNLHTAVILIIKKRYMELAHFVVSIRSCTADKAALGATWSSWVSNPTGSFRRTAILKSM
jgi:hypothetical protein